MKNILNLLVLLTLMGSLDGLQAQSSTDTSEYEFFVSLEALTPIDTIFEYLKDLNSAEVWHHEYSGLALWSVTGYPFTMADGTEIFDINDVIRQSVRKTKINEADFNILSAIEDTTVSSQNSIFDPLNYSIAQGSLSIVKISILDTGIDPDIETSTTDELNYNLTNYTGYDYVNKDSIPEDEHGHGSHIAGIIHSITNGVDSLGDKIVFDIRKTHNDLGQGFMSNIVKGLLDAVDEGANVVNMSFGRTDTFSVNSFFPLRQAIQHAQNQNVIVVVSAGNNGKDIDILTNSTTPAIFPEGNIVTVAALSNSDSLSWFSNFGYKNVDIAVLGEFIPGPDLSGGLRYSSGTSQATAIASAVAALVGTYKGEYDASIMKCALNNGAVPIDGLSDLILTEGKVNINASLQQYQNPQQEYTVTNINNSGPGSLRYAIEGVCGVKKVFFHPNINGQTIELLDKELMIDSPIEFRGNSQTQTLINGLDINTIYIGFNGDLKLRDLKISNNSSNSGSIYNKGKLQIINNVRIE